MAARIRRRLRITGRVQGVWYRGSMQHEAARLGLAGWVKNCRDGSVETVVEGPPDAVHEIVAWCRRGPTGAQVTGVDEIEEPVEGLEGFDIDY